MTKRKHNKQSKINIKIILLFILGIIVTLGVIGQIVFDAYLWNVDKLNSAFVLRTSFKDAILDVEATRNSLIDRQKIPEARLILPSETNNGQNIRYVYYSKDEDQPETIDIGTVELTNAGIISLNGQNEHEVLDNVPESQACARGFHIYFEDPKVPDSSSDKKVVGVKKLADNREIYLVREMDCGRNPKLTQYNNSEAPNFDRTPRYQMMDELEEYLLQIQSY
ncbi:MAG: hypothetical protein H6793_00160 [Candidatus Nomurabacteria bacterium]|nr:MAG: hypothetical protein H6793_00160 [Candidatus Nomurabacteria bacterium]